MQHVKAVTHKLEKKSKSLQAKYLRSNQEKLLKMLLNNLLHRAYKGYVLYVPFFNAFYNVAKSMQIMRV
ncbi:hypothetical protein GCM10007971_16300 [Oceanobacillus indicireducens]|uniref:Uncharacterized protein n=1 Tax=Oceanobacillus indicireducens TaxID=1004261 RepID=A0A917XW55_9BACI|nr:hypothetical protein GCM10007971_16300 [Oceanobacillus indicireducens]